MKQIIDQVTGETIAINLITTGRNAASLTMCANGILLTETVRGADLAAAKRAFCKRDLEGFGSFFDRAERAEAA